MGADKVLHVKSLVTVAKANAQRMVATVPGIPRNGNTELKAPYQVIKVG